MKTKYLKNPAIGAEIAKEREKQGFTQTTMAERLAGAMKSKYGMRQYQKIEAGEFPKFKQNVVKAIDSILNTTFLSRLYEQKVPREMESHGTHVSGVTNFNSPLPLGNLVVTLGDYVDLLKKQVEVYQKMAEANLGTILKNQEIGGGIVQEILERDVLREAKGNPQKAKELLEAIRLKISETSAITLIKYTHDGEGIARK